MTSALQRGDYAEFLSVPRLELDHKIYPHIQYYFKPPAPIPAGSRGQHASRLPCCNSSNDHIVWSGNRCSVSPCALFVCPLHVVCGVEAPRRWRSWSSTPLDAGERRKLCWHPSRVVRPCSCSFMKCRAAKKGASWLYFDGCTQCKEVVARTEWQEIKGGVLRRAG